MNQQSAISNQQDAMKRQEGFTLIELSIVLVIIGLIVGGVLVGQDLITAAQSRKLLSSTQAIDVAINTFRVKYGEKPGDMRSPSRIGFTTCTGPYAGNGDRKIKGYSTLPFPTYSAIELRGEPVLMWRHLFEAGLNISSSVDGTGIFQASCNIGPLASDSSLERFLPRNPIGKGYLHVGNVFAGNEHKIGIIVSAFGFPTSTNLTAAVLQKEMVQSIDVKIDDGVPTSGRVQAYGTNGSTPDVPSGSKSASQCGTSSYLDSCSMTEMKIELDVLNK